MAFKGYAQNEEYTLKAVYIEKLTRFISWPYSAFKFNSGDSIVFGIYGETALTEIAKQLYKDREIKSKKVKIVQLNDSSDFSKCNILFISNLPENKLYSLFDRLYGKPILTISDTKEYAEKGIMINFIIRNGRIKFEINKAVVDKSPLYFNHLLLSQAIKVIT